MKTYKCHKEVKADRPDVRKEAIMINTDRLFDKLRSLGCVIEPCGSRVTCDPAPTDTDADYLVVAPSSKDAIAKINMALCEEEFELEGGEHYQVSVAGGFTSWRLGDINLIISANDDFVMRHRAATSIAKRFNLMVKADRIALFAAVLYGTAAIEVQS